MSEKWCHLNGEHAPHPWRSLLGMFYNCPGHAREEDQGE